jgi:hypothetical protein
MQREVGSPIHFCLFGGYDAKSLIGSWDCCCADHYATPGVACMGCGLPRVHPRDPRRDRRVQYYDWGHVLQRRWGDVQQRVDHVNQGSIGTSPALTVPNLGGTELGLQLNYTAAGPIGVNTDFTWTMNVAGNVLGDAFAQLTGAGYVGRDYKQHRQPISPARGLADAFAIASPS